MGRPRVFDRDDLAVAGLAVVARDGWAAVSVRAVAAELGVTPMALYRVVADARALRIAVADAAAGPLVSGTGTGTGTGGADGGGSGDGDDLLGGLERWAVDGYAHLGAYPGLASFVLATWTELPGWLDVVESLLARVAGHGLAGPEAVALVNAVFAYVLARAQLRDAAAAAPRRRLAPVAADPDRYPRIGATLDEFTVARTDRHFRYGLAALAAGLRLAAPGPHG
ncbi:MAG TPA: TetR/AcrR family transcriptional regulator C-terminal domain-containing protein [Acidimicrobiales bacterium]|nr:TetR/AcrR family transcriptional regulator C-terminal domain-containing protein [Acidimicrobiales bacterium]